MLSKIFLLLWLASSAAWAGDVLEQIASQLSKAEISQGHFTQEKQLKFLHKPLLSAGEFTYQQSQGVIWKTLQPVVSLLLVNDSRLLSNQGEQAVPPGFARVLQAILGGNLAQLNEDFVVSGEIQAAQWTVQLQPKDPLVGKIIAGLTLSGDSELRSLEIRETSGNLATIRFEHITHPQQLSPEQQAEFARLQP